MCTRVVVSPPLSARIGCFSVRTASRRKRRGRKRQSLRRSSFTAFCRLSRRFALLPARTIPLAGRSIRRRVARWTTPSPRSRNAATCHCPRTRSRRFPTSPALVRTNRTTERVLRGQQRASWRGVAWRGVLARRSITVYMAACLRAPPCKPLRCVCVPPTSQLEHVEVVSR